MSSFFLYLYYFHLRLANWSQNKECWYVIYEVNIYFVIPYSLILVRYSSPASSPLLLFSWPQRGRMEIEIHPNKNQQPQSGWTRVLIDLTTRNIPPSTPAGGYTGQSNNRSLILKSNARMFMIRYSKTPIPRTPLFQIGAQKLSDY